MKKLKLFSSIVVLSIMLFGCQEEEAVPGTDNFNATSDPNGVPHTFVFADCELFESVVTPATFSPESTPFDILFAGNFKDGVGLISDAKPGDQDYNGGRWNMYALKQGVDPNKYINACSEEDLDIEDFESTNNYFECPLLPRRGGGN